MALSDTEYLSMRYRLSYNGILIGLLRALLNAVMCNGEINVMIVPHCRV